jgi:Zn-dependent protease with chaperone function
MTIVTAYYYDGISARRYAVTLSVADGRLAMQGEEASRHEPFSTVRISEKLGSAPRLIHFSDGGHCEVVDHPAFDMLLKEAGHRPHSLVSHLEGRWRYALTAVLLTFASGVAAYLWGLPWAAKLAASRIPYSTAHILDEHAMHMFDGGMMQPSKLSAERQQALQQRFNDLRAGHELPPYLLEFRSSKSIGANAFALPGGTVVITDELVGLAGNDEEVLAVLAHELGHVSERHPMRQLLQSSAVALTMTWYLGDVSSLLATAPTLLLQTSYSRDFERRADRFAANMLRENGMQATRLADILEKLESSHRGARREETHRSSATDLLSSHPDTGERIRALRDGASATH